MGAGAWGWAPRPICPPTVLDRQTGRGRRTYLQTHLHVTAGTSSPNPSLAGTYPQGLFLRAARSQPHAHRVQVETSWQQRLELGTLGSSTQVAASLSLEPSAFLGSLLAEPAPSNGPT